MKHRLSFLSGFAFSLVLLIALLVLPFGSARADGPAPTPTPAVPAPTPTPAPTPASTGISLAEYNAVKEELDRLKGEAQKTADAQKVADDAATAARQTMVDHHTDQLLSQAGAHNPAHVKALLATKIELDDKHQPKNADAVKAAFEAMKKDAATSYLFKAAGAPPANQPVRSPGSTTVPPTDSGASVPVRDGQPKRLTLAQAIKNKLSPATA